MLIADILETFNYLYSCSAIGLIGEAIIELTGAAVSPRMVRA
jgi:hypothetical protein